MYDKCNSSVHQARHKNIACFHHFVSAIQGEVVTLTPSLYRYVLCLYRECSTSFWRWRPRHVTHHGFRSLKFFLKSFLPLLMLRFPSSISLALPAFISLLFVFRPSLALLLLTRYLVSSSFLPFRTTLRKAHRKIECPLALLKPTSKERKKWGLYICEDPQAIFPCLFSK